jgi:hypothetical protein
VDALASARVALAAAARRALIDPARMDAVRAPQADTAHCARAPAMTAPFDCKQRPQAVSLTFAISALLKCTANRIQK